MNDYELSDLIATNVGNMYMDSAGFFTLFSAYIVMTYLIGDKLTRFQVSFINAVFLGLMASSMISVVNLINKNVILLNQLHEIDPQLHPAADYGELSAFAFVGFRVLVVIGCFIFMWQVRNGNSIRHNT